MNAGNSPARSGDSSAGQRRRGLPLPSLSQILLTLAVIGGLWLLRSDLQSPRLTTEGKFDAEGEPINRIQEVEKLVAQGSFGVAQLVEMLGSHEAKDRRLALYGLARLKSQESLPEIRPLLTNPDPEVRRAALESYGLICENRHEVIPLAIQMLDDASEIPRLLALELLDSYGTASIPELAKLASSPKSTLRWAVVELLAKIDRNERDPQPADIVLRELMQDADLEVRIAATEAVAARGAATVEEIRTWMTATEPRVVNAAFRAACARPEGDTSLLPELEASLSQPGSLYLHQLRALRRLRHAAASTVPRLFQVFPSQPPTVQIDLLKTLMALEAPAADLRALVVPLLNSTDSALRVAAASTLTQIDQEAAEQQVATLVNQLAADESAPNPDRLETLRGFGPLAAEALPLLMRWLDDANDEVVRRTLLVLRAMGPAAAPALPTLQEMLRQTDLREHHRRFVQITLTLGAIGPDAKSELPRLLDLLANAPRMSAPNGLRVAAVPDRRLELVWAISRIAEGSPEVATLLQKSLQTVNDLDAPLPGENSGFRRTIVEGLAAFQSAHPELLDECLPLLHDKVTVVRMQAALTISRWQGDRQAAVEPLSELLTDPDCYVRTAAALALESIGPAAASAVPDLEAACRDTRNSVPNLFKRQPRALNGDLVLYGDDLGEYSVSEVARRALGAIAAAGPAGSRSD
ncbi:MAG: HEAT repeat domain-containing protein [Planctomycetes bacterium]|nr:HEAT repeat domain-containing protein [Planctomycetota bacterium]